MIKLLLASSKRAKKSSKWNGRKSVIRIIENHERKIQTETANGDQAGWLGIENDPINEVMKKWLVDTCKCQKIGGSFIGENLI